MWLKSEEIKRKRSLKITFLFPLRSLCRSLWPDMAMPLAVAVPAGESWRRGGSPDAVALPIAGELVAAAALPCTVARRRLGFALRLSRCSGSTRLVLLWSERIPLIPVELAWAVACVGLGHQTNTKKNRPILWVFTGIQGHTPSAANVPHPLTVSCRVLS